MNLHVAGKKLSVKRLLLKSNTVIFYDHIQGVSKFSSNQNANKSYTTKRAILCIGLYVVCILKLSLVPTSAANG